MLGVITSSLVVLCLLSATLAQSTTNCAALSNSCAQCNMAPNCSYYWSAPTFYNSSNFGVCTSTTQLALMMYANEYQKTVYAYALPESQINTTLGQYKLTTPDSSLNYGALAVPCYDRQLCYCKPMPPPPPSTLRVLVKSCATGLALGGVTVTLTSSSTNSSANTTTLTRTTGVDGTAVWYPIAPGSYLPNFAATGYVSATGNLTGIAVNQTINVSICLTPVPCLLTVYTILASNSSAFPGPLVSVNGAAGVASPSSAASNFSLPAGTSGSVSGNFAGYYPTTGSFSCGTGGGGTPTVNLSFVPIPNTITVMVRDLRTNLPISGANISLTTFANTLGDSTGSSTYTPVAAGLYTAGATAAGYYPNTTAAGPVTYNQTIVVTIYLKEIPCTVTVTVVDSLTNTTISGASVSLNYAVAVPPSTTNNQGFVIFTILYDAANTVNASAVGYAPNSTGFVPLCTRGASVNVIIYLNEVIQVRIAAKNALALPTDPNPYLSFATIYWNGVLVPNDPSNPTYKLLTLPSLPATGTISAYAGGFNNATGSATFTTTVRYANISLAPNQFTIYFVANEILIDGSSVNVPYSGAYSNNYPSVYPNTSTTAYTSTTIKIGGSVNQVITPLVSVPYVSNTSYVSTDPAKIAPPVYYYASVWTDLSPTSTSPFYVDTTVPLAAMLFNHNKTTGSTSLAFVPDFENGPERNLLISLPYVLNAAFLNIRVFPFASDGVTRIPFASSPTFVGMSFNGKYTSYANMPVTTNLAVFEYAVVFGTPITSINVVQDGTFNFSTTGPAPSNWINPDTGLIFPYGAQPVNFTTFNFPPSDGTFTTFVSTLPNGQQARDPTLNLFALRDYGLVKNVGSTKKEVVVPPQVDDLTNYLFGYGYVV